MTKTEQQMKFIYWTVTENIKNEMFRRSSHRRTGRGGEGGCSPPKFWATEIFWAARETLGKDVSMFI